MFDIMLKSSDVFWIDSGVFGIIIIKLLQYFWRFFMSLVAIMKGVFGVVESVGVIRRLVDGLDSTPSAVGQQKPIFSCCGQPQGKGAPQRSPKFALMDALWALNNKVKGAGAPTKHTDFDLQAVLGVLDGLTAELTARGVDDSHVQHFNVLRALLRHLEGKAKDSEDRNTALSGVLQLMSDVLHGSDEISQDLLTLIQHPSSPHFESLFQDVLTSSEPAVSAPSAGDSEVRAEEGALKDLFNVDTLDKDILLGFLSKLQAHQNDEESAQKIKSGLFGKLMRSAQEAFVSRHTDDDASAEAHAALRALLGKNSNVLIETAREVSHDDSDEELIGDTQKLILSLSKAFHQRAPMRHVGLVMLSALATVPGVQPYWASLLSMITASSQTPMLLICGIGALALGGLILLARQHFKAYKAIKSLNNALPESANLALLQKLHRRNGLAQIALGALFVGVAGFATYVQWPLIASVFMGASMVVQGLMVALSALLVIAVVYFGVQAFKDHGKIHDVIRSAHSTAESLSSTDAAPARRARARAAVDVVAVPSAARSAAAADRSSLNDGEEAPALNAAAS